MSAPIKLTKGEQAMLADRLSMPDLFVQVFTDVPEGEPEPTFTEDQILEAVSVVTAAVDRGVLFPDSLDNLQRSVLIEAIEGSTWAAGFVTGDPAKAGAMRVMRSAATKFIVAGIANEIDVPQR